MILAAGRGTRMAPLSEFVAKPALPLLGKPLILRLARNLARQGIDEIVVNTYSHPGTIADALSCAPLPVHYSREEPELLGSGGGILGARPLLDGDEPFLVINADMALDLDIGSMIASHRRAGALVTLALRDDPRKQEFGTIGYDTGGRVRRITSRLDLGGEAANGLFIGVHVMEPAVFELMPEGPVFEIISDVYIPALERGVAFNAWLQPLSQRWCPIGSPAELLAANLEAVAALGSDGVVVDPSARVDGEVIPPVWVGAEASVAADSRVGPNAVVGARGRVQSQVELQNSVVLDGCSVPLGSKLQNAIAFQGGVWPDG